MELMWYFLSLLLMASCSGLPSQGVTRPSFEIHDVSWTTIRCDAQGLNADMNGFTGINLENGDQTSHTAASISRSGPSDTLSIKDPNDRQICVAKGTLREDAHFILTCVQCRSSDARNNSCTRFQDLDQFTDNLKCVFFSVSGRKENPSLLSHENAVTFECSAQFDDRTGSDVILKVPLSDGKQLRLRASDAGKVSDAGNELAEYEHPNLGNVSVYRRRVDENITVLGVTKLKLGLFVVVTSKDPTALERWKKSAECSVAVGSIEENVVCANCPKESDASSVPVTTTVKETFEMKHSENEGFHAVVNPVVVCILAVLCFVLAVVVAVMMGFLCCRSRRRDGSSKKTPPAYTEVDQNTDV